jgi:hypothetical protein
VEGEGCFPRLMEFRELTVFFLQVAFA